MINQVLAIKDKYSYVCKWIRPEIFQCGKCNRGIVAVFMTDNRQRIFQDKKSCKVCNAKFKVTEVLR